MDYRKLEQQLKSTSLFDLYNLRYLIGARLENQEALSLVRNQLQLEVQISYHDLKSNSMKYGVVKELKKKSVIVVSLDDQKAYRIPYYVINLAGEIVDLGQLVGSFSKLDFFVNQIVGFKDKKGRDLYGKVIKLNPKSAVLVTSDNMRWRVSYGLLFKVVDSDLVNYQIEQKLAIE